MAPRDWEEGTDPLPGSMGERSLELELDPARIRAPVPSPSLSPEAALASLWPEDRQDLGAPDLVVFEPSTHGLSARIASLGYPVRVADSGVEVMSLVSQRPTGAVVCGPMRDGERRRLLTGALRVRFPQVPVIYVTTHAGTVEGVHGAIREGAQGVLPWPLPPDEKIHACLGGYVRPRSTPPPSRRAPGPADRAAPASRVANERVERAPASAISPTAKAAPNPAPPTTTRAPPRSEPLLSALAPFLWSLQDAADWAERRARLGDAEAHIHAQTLRTLRRLLDQLQERDDGRPR